MAKGGGWVLAWRMASRLLGLISTLILVRLLDQSDFGLITLAYGFAASLEACLAIGVELQIVRAKDPSRGLYDTAFTLNAIRGAILSLLVIVGAAPIAMFFGEPRMENVIYVLALMPLLGGLTNVGVMEFQRALDFGKEFRLDIVPRLIQVVAAVGAAVTLRSYWALLIGIVVSRLLRVVMSYVLHPFRPHLSFSAWRELIGVSFWTWAVSIVNVVRDRMDTFVVGRLLGLHPVGIYTVALEIATLPASELVTPIGHTSMAGFAATNRSATTAMAPTFLRLIGFTTLVALPTGIGVSLVAGAIVALALGQPWAAATGLIQMFGFGGVFLSVGLICRALHNALALLRAMFFVSVTGAVLRVGLLLLLAPAHGLTGVGLAVMLATVVENGVVIFMAARRVQVRIVDILPRVWRPTAATVVMAFALWSLGLGWGDVPPSAWLGGLELAQGAMLGALVYGITLGTLWWVAGRPQDAPESDALEIIRRSLRAVRLRLGWRG